MTLIMICVNDEIRRSQAEARAAVGAASRWLLFIVHFHLRSEWLHSKDHLRILRNSFFPLPERRWEKETFGIELLNIDLDFRDLYAIQSGASFRRWRWQRASERPGGRGAGGEDKQLFRINI